MDYKFIILAIVGIIVAYIIYSYAFATPGTNVSKNTIYLGGSNNTNITLSKLTSTIYTSDSPSYYAWVYINTPPSNNAVIQTGTSGTNFGNLNSKGSSNAGTIKSLFYLNGIAGTAAQPAIGSNGYYAWALDSTGHNLYVVYNTSVATAGDPSISSQTVNCVQVSDNIPLQSWIFITVVLDSTVTPNIMDVYMNGKLTKSIILDNKKYQPPIPPSGVTSSTTTSTLTGGILGNPPNIQAITWGTGQDIYISNLTGFAIPLSPDDVQKAYLSFSGQNAISSNTIHLGISATKGSDKSLISSDFQIW